MEDPWHSWHFPEPANVIAYGCFPGRRNNACVVRRRDLASEPAISDTTIAMSIARQLLREFRPLVPDVRGAVREVYAVDVSEEGDKYVVEADLPGVKKENVEIIVGDGGRSITIQGKTPATRRGAPESQSQEASSGTAATEGTEAVTTADQSQNQLTTERLWSGSSIFTRTVWLPRPVDRSKVKAKLEDGILTLQAPKAEDQETVKVPVE
ncbi:HSP20-like chaperone [Pisolithus croceorrhizus]|nr:HSP20-like chaperone [Pisolithus croceorrhizus]